MVSKWEAERAKVIWGAVMDNRGRKKSVDRKSHEDVDSCGELSSLFPFHHSHTLLLVLLVDCHYAQSPATPISPHLVL